MAIFSRRRLQSMLDDISCLIARDKALDLLNRLEKSDVEQSLPAEMELALLWGISKFGEMDVEPEWWGDTRRPDVVTGNFIPETEVAIEIAATSDNSISGEKEMDRVALRISEFANGLKRGFGDFLYFSFGEAFSFKSGNSIRSRLVRKDFSLSESAKAKIQYWVTNHDSKWPPLLIREPGLSVTIERKQSKQDRYYNTFSSMPPQTQSLTKNPLASVLRRKLDQLRAANPNTMRLIFIADVGSTLINRIGSIGERSAARSQVSGSEIISNFVRLQAPFVDGVVAFTPHRKFEMYRRNKVNWKAHVFASSPETKNQIQAAVDRLLHILPKPRFEGYQARSIFRQNGFSPSEMGWYIGVNIVGRAGDVKVSIPARAFLDLLAGRITPEQFAHFLGDKPRERGLFGGFLDRGETLSKIEMAPRNLDEDDDHIILHFTDDPAARKLKLGSDG